MGVFEKSEFDRNTGVFALKTVTPQPMNLTVIQSIEKLSVKRKAQYSIRKVRSFYEPSYGILISFKSFVIFADLVLNSVKMTTLLKDMRIA